MANSQKQNGKKRLINLEVDEVSLVDKPAIGEAIYLTKRVSDEGKGNTLEVQTTNVNKTNEGENPEPQVEDPKSENEIKEPELIPDPNVNDVDATKALADQFNGRLGKIEKNLSDVESMLTQSLELHEMLSAHMNELLALNMGALDAVMMLMEESEDDYEAPEGESAPAPSEPQKMALITNIRGCIKAVNESVSKAGAKISRGRLAVLRELATKLAELIQSAEAQAKQGGKKGDKKKAEVLKSVQTTIESFSGEIGGLKDVSDALREKLSVFDERLKNVESTAGASNAIVDEENGTPNGETNAANKSIFSGLIPKDDVTRINKSVRKTLIRK